jgi:hypothetical protein
MLRVGQEGGVSVWFDRVGRGGAAEHVRTGRDKQPERCELLVECLVLRVVHPLVRF